MGFGIEERWEFWGALSFMQGLGYTEVFDGFILDQE